MKKLMHTQTQSHTSIITLALRYAVAIILIVIPFHAFLTVWAASLAGHYTALRLWKEVLLAALVVGCLVAEMYRRHRWAAWTVVLVRSPLVVSILAYVMLLGVMGGLALSSEQVSLRAFAYGLLLDSRFLVFFLVCWYVSQRDGWLGAHWRQILLIPAIAVVAFGLLQAFVLPTDVLTHFGYGAQTIDAVQTVDQKASYMRIQSTLRGANPLGVYLVLILSAAVALTVRFRAQRPKYALLATACIVVLAMTFSRSAWIGTAAATLLLALSTIRSGRARGILLGAAAAALVLLAGAGYSLRNNDAFQNAFLHTDEHSLSSTSSNQGHLAAARDGLGDIVYQPEGRGTGTAGPASVYSNHPARIAENYFLQIGQEIGIVGLGLFAAVNVLVGRELWRRRSNVLAVVLLASLVGITVVNMLSHAWTDDTLSYIWWGLAGIALALPATATHTAAVKPDKTKAKP